MHVINKIYVHQCNKNVDDKFSARDGLLKLPSVGVHAYQL